MRAVLHLHNGDVTAQAARRALIPGNHVAFRETLVVGPIDEKDWIESRARYLSQAYGEHLLRVRNDLITQERLIDEASQQPEVVLWFEHDLFCFANLLYLLTRLSHPRLTLIWNPQPLGNLPFEDLIPLFESRAAVTPSMLKVARPLWKAFASPDPIVLNEWAGGVDDAEFPFARAAMRLHASRFPSVRNGLGAVENRAMELIASGVADFNAIFSRFSEEVPRFGLGDGEFLRMLWQMANVAVPLITMTETSDTPPKRLFTITAAGENVRSGTVDAIGLNGIETWLGGVHLTKENLWRWDEGARQIVPSRAAVS